MWSILATVVLFYVLLYGPCTQFSLLYGCCTQFSLPVIPSQPPHPLRVVWSIRASVHGRFWPPWIEHTNINESGRTSDQFTVAVLKTQPAPFSWRSGGRLGKWNKWNKWLYANGRPNNRSGVYSILCSTPSIGSSLPPSSCSHNDWKECKGLLWGVETDYWSGENTST